MVVGSSSYHLAIAIIGGCRIEAVGFVLLI
jgi:hypothetical protein